METLESDIKRFLEPGYGSGYGSGSGSGYGDGDGLGSGLGSGDGDGDGDGSGLGLGSGYGDGYGSGSGYGSGYGSGSGSGYGDVSGYGVKSFAGQKVYYIDSVPTLIDSVHRTYAKGHILNKDHTLTPCYIARVGNYFAHGETLHKAHDDAQKKELQNMPVEKRIERFILEHPDYDKESGMNMKYPAQDLFDWHGILTGSCKMGREQFCKEYGINVKTDSFTIKKFVELTLDAYGGSVIKQLADTYGIKKDVPKKGL